jgi:hypothetical protein
VNTDRDARPISVHSLLELGQIDATPGTHQPAMYFNVDALIQGVVILPHMTRRIVNVN